MKNKPSISIIIRTLNEERWLLRTLVGLRNQKDLKGQKINLEIIIVDSGSQDNTTDLIATLDGIQLYELRQKTYFPGKAINFGFSKAKGDITVVLSAHCVPTDEFSIAHLVRPVVENKDIVASYGRQIPMESSGADDARDLIMTFRNEDKIQRFDGFIHNAFSAYSSAYLKNNLFDETVRHVEDLVWGRKAVSEQTRIFYASEAKVFHHHGLHQHQKNKSFRANGVLRHLDVDLNIDCPLWLKPSNYNVATILYGNWQNNEEFSIILDQLSGLDNYYFPEISKPSDKIPPSVNLITRSQISKSQNYGEFLNECALEISSVAGKAYEVFILVDADYVQKKSMVLHSNLKNVCERGYDGSFLAVQENHQMITLDSEGEINTLGTENGTTLAKLCFGQFGVITNEALKEISTINQRNIFLEVEKQKEFGARYAR